MGSAGPAGPPGPPGAVPPGEAHPREAHPGGGGGEGGVKEVKVDGAKEMFGALTSTVAALEGEVAALTPPPLLSKS